MVAAAGADHLVEVPDREPVLRPRAHPLHVAQPCVAWDVCVLVDGWMEIEVETSRKARKTSHARTGPPAEVLHGLIQHAAGLPHRQLRADELSCGHDITRVNGW